MLDISRIKKVYNGRIGCMCGCLGKYSYNEGVADEPWQDEVNVRSIKIIAGKVLKNPLARWEEGYVVLDNKETNRRQVIYFKD